MGDPGLQALTAPERRRGGGGMVVGGLPSLTSLHLGGNAIGYEGATALWAAAGKLALPLLRELNLSANRLTDGTLAARPSAVRCAKASFSARSSSRTIR